MIFSQLLIGTITHVMHARCHLGAPNVISMDRLRRGLASLLRLLLRLLLLLLLEEHQSLVGYCFFHQSVQHHLCSRGQYETKQPLPNTGAFGRLCTEAPPSNVCLQHPQGS
jgi:hypothetical protein